MQITTPLAGCLCWVGVGNLPHLCPSPTKRPPYYDFPSRFGEAYTSPLEVEEPPPELRLESGSAESISGIPIG